MSEDLGEIGRRLHEQICDQMCSGKDSKSHMLKYSHKITIHTFLWKISVYFEMVILIANSRKKYQEHCLLKNCILR